MNSGRRPARLERHARPKYDLPCPARALLRCAKRAGGRRLWEVAARGRVRREGAEVSGLSGREEREGLPRRGDEEILVAGALRDAEQLFVGIELLGALGEADPVAVGIEVRDLPVALTEKETAPVTREDLLGAQPLVLRGQRPELLLPRQQHLHGTIVERDHEDAVVRGRPLDVAGLGDLEGAARLRLALGAVDLDHRRRVAVDGVAADVEPREDLVDGEVPDALEPAVGRQVDLVAREVREELERAFPRQGDDEFRLRDVAFETLRQGLADERTELRAAAVEPADQLLERADHVRPDTDLLPGEVEDLPHLGRDAGDRELAGGGDGHGRNEITLLRHEENLEL